MLTFKSLKEMLAVQAVPHELYLEIRSALQDSDVGDPLDLNFEDELGGGVCIVQELSDLGEVKGVYSTATDDTQLSVLEGVPGFDAAHRLPSQDWAFLMLATSDAGGTGYFVPWELVEQVPNLKAVLTEAGDGEVETRTMRGELKTFRRVSPISCTVIERQIPDAKQLTADEHKFLRHGTTAKERLALA